MVLADLASIAASSAVLTFPTDGAAILLEREFPLPRGGASDHPSLPTPTPLRRPLASRCELQVERQRRPENGSPVQLSHPARLVAQSWGSIRISSLTPLASRNQKPTRP
jgi:hypothetical protein